jgi:uncharacterized protein (TIGR03435 family)
MTTLHTPAVLFCMLLAGREAAAHQPIALVDEATLPRFEIASVKPGGSGPPRAEATPGRFVNENMPLLNAVSLAFDLPPHQIATPLPNVVRELFTIEGRMRAGTSNTDLTLMVRALLVDRFKLRVHVETREQDAYALTILRRDGSLGAQLRPSPVDCRARMEALRRNEAVAPPPAGSKPCDVKLGPGLIDLSGMPLTSLAQWLSNASGRPVVDKTGLTGMFDVEVRWSPSAWGPPRGDADAAPTGGDEPSIFAAIQEQLGLKLEGAKTSVSYLVIDQIERPEPD